MEKKHKNPPGNFRPRVPNMHAIDSYSTRSKYYLRMFGYILQSREPIPVYFIDHSEFITGQCKKILSRVNKNKIKCFDFGSINRALRSHLRTIITG